MNTLWCESCHVETSRCPLPSIYSAAGTADREHIFCFTGTTEKLHFRTQKYEEEEQEEE